MAAKKQVLCFRIRPKFIEELDKIAENKDTTRSELVRTIVENYVVMHK